MMTDLPGHWRRLERMYLAAPTNDYYHPTISIAEGSAEIAIEVRPEFFHAAQAVHGSVYFKLLDDAGYFAVNSLVRDVLVLTSDFTVHLLRPISAGALRATGQLLNLGTSQGLAEARLYDSHDKLVAHGTGTYVRSRIALTPDVGYV